MIRGNDDLCGVSTVWSIERMTKAQGVLKTILMHRDLRAHAICISNTDTKLTSSHEQLAAENFRMHKYRKTKQE